MGSSRNWPSSLFDALPRDAAVCVGFSGGVDSTVLLDLLAKQRAGKVSAVHVHHGLSPNADRWAAACESFCRERGVPLDVVRVAVDRRAGTGLEAAAREARYAVFAKRREPFVALAHHLDDQAETVLLQLLRGTGLKGVAAMPLLRPLAGSKATLYRPLLAVSRDAIVEYARAMKLTWVDDESNASVAQDRNYLRHEIGPRLAGRFPSWRESVGRFARHAAEADALLAAQAAADGGGAMSLHLSSKLPVPRRANAVRAFLASHGLAMPSERRLTEMARQLYDSRDDARPRIEHDGVVISRHRGEVLVERVALRAADSWRIEWRGQKRVALGDGRGQVRFESAQGTGIDATLANEGEWFFMPRSGGEKMRISAKGRTRTLKNLLQEHAVPAIRRDHLPLLFRGQDLVWVPGVGIAAAFACGPRRKGLLPCWTVAGEAGLC